MANKKTLLGADFPRLEASPDGFGPVIRKTIDVLKDEVSSSHYYAVACLPVGFVPRQAAVRVLDDVADAVTNVTVAVAVGTAADEDGVIDDVTVLAASGTNYAAGTVAAASLVAGSVSSSTATLAPAIVSGSTPVYLWVKVGAGVVKGKFEIAVVGDKMFV